LRIFRAAKAPWNGDVMEVIDPFGDRLRFSQAFDSGTRACGA
jgi:hypothetical protein